MYNEQDPEKIWDEETGEKINRNPIPEKLEKIFKNYPHLSQNPSAEQKREWQTLK